MKLGELIKVLESKDLWFVVRRGFLKPHSYRGFYEQVAFKPMENVTVGEMLNDVCSAIGETLHGYKGGICKIGESTEVWLAYPGETGEQIGPTLLKYMLEGAEDRVPDDECKKNALAKVKERFERDKKDYLRDNWDNACTDIVGESDFALWEWLCKQYEKKS